MRSAAFLVACGVCASVHATTSPTEEIARRSGLPASEVAALLKNCEASQTSTNFCAWRDQLVAEQHLQLAISRKNVELPGCKLQLEKKVSTWTGQRDRACQSAAQRDWSTGSMRNAAQSMCSTKGTERIIEDVKHFRCR